MGLGDGKPMVDKLVCVSRLMAQYHMFMVHGYLPEGGDIPGRKDAWCLIQGQPTGKVDGTGEGNMTVSGNIK